MFTNEKNTGKNFGEEIIKQLEDANHLEVASGYFGWRDLKQLRPKLLDIAKRGSCKLLFGMIFHERATSKQKNCLLEIDEQLKEINDVSGIFVALRPYHGKVYRVVHDHNEMIYVGSSNFSISGFKQNMEFNLKIADPCEKRTTVDFLDFLFGGEGKRKKISCPLSDVDLKLKSDTDKDLKNEKTLRDFEICKEVFPVMANEGFFKIKHRPSVQLESSLNLYFDKGRKVVKNGRSLYTPRPWYEVEVTSQKEERDHKDYPTGEWIAYVEDDGKYYKLQMVTSSGDKDSPKALQTSKAGGGRKVLGELIKGKMERMGVLQRYTKITDDILDEYGKDYIELKKIYDDSYLMKV